MVPRPRGVWGPRADGPLRRRRARRVPHAASKSSRWGDARVSRGRFCGVVAGRFAADADRRPRRADRVPWQPRRRDVGSSVTSPPQVPRGRAHRRGGRGRARVTDARRGARAQRRGRPRAPGRRRGVVGRYRGPPRRARARLDGLFDGRPRPSAATPTGPSRAALARACSGPLRRQLMRATDSNRRSARRRTAARTARRPSGDGV